MKKLLFTFVLGLLLSGNVYAQIIKLSCDPKGAGSNAASDFKSEFYKLTIDTKLKKFCVHVKSDTHDTNSYMSVISMDDRFIIYEAPTYKGNVMLFDYINYIGVTLEPGYFLDWDYRCVSDQ
jgi:hypothetical protein